MLSYVFQSLNEDAYKKIQMEYFENVVELI